MFKTRFWVGMMLVGVCVCITNVQAEMFNLTGPSGPVVDGVSGTNAVLINGSWFVNVLEAEASTGSGVIHSFVRIHGNGQAGAVEQGYNTDARPVQFDENTSPTFTRSLLLSQVPIVQLVGHGDPGTLYREFLLDINQQNHNPLLALDDIEIFQAAAGNLTDYDLTNHDLGPLGVKRYDLDAHSTGDNWILLNYALDTGSGGGDMFAFLPNDLFDPANGAYVYLYSHFGEGGGGAYPNNDGYEEWAVRTAENTVVPLPGAALLGMLGLGAAGLRLRRAV